MGVPQYATSYTPAHFPAIYGTGSTPAASGTAIALFMEGDLTQTVKDLRTEETANGLPQVPVTIVATGAASSDTSGQDEWDLDSQVSSGMAGTVSQMYLYDATVIEAVCTTSAFHDVTVGTNGGFVATPGWDYTTGVGSFDVAEANTLVK